MDSWPEGYTLLFLLPTSKRTAVSTLPHSCKEKKKKKLNMDSGADRNIVGPLLLTFQHNGLLFLNCADIQGLQNTARRNSLSLAERVLALFGMLFIVAGKLRGYGGAWRPSWSAMDRSRRVPNSTATYSLTILGTGEEVDRRKPRPREE